MARSHLFRTAAALAALLLSHSAAAPLNIAGAEEGFWSRSAHGIPRGRDFRVPSPDRKRTVLVKEQSLIVLDGGAPVPGIEGYSLYLPAEVAWAPDSKAFAVTMNEGGGEEAWSVTAYLLENDRVSYYEVTVQAAEKFKELVKCSDAWEPGFGAIKWIKESKHLLVAAEVPARSSCATAEPVRGFIVEVPSGKVLAEFPPKKFAEDWGEFLGPRVMRRLRR